MKMLCLGLLLVVPMAMAQSSSLNQSLPVNWEPMLQAAGVNDVLGQANVLIDQEIRNLKKAPLGFSPEELQNMSDSFREQLGSEKLKQDIVARLSAELSEQELRRLQSVLRSQELKKLNQLQAQLSDAEVRRAMRSYRVKIKESAPSNARMELLASLDNLLKQSSLEAELKVELRKQLLATVSQMKTNQIFTEDMLDEQLHDYRQDVEGEISKNALYAYLYLLKRTPSSKVRDLLVSLDEPAFNSFMRICLQAMQESFLQAREQMQDDVRLAGK